VHISGIDIVGASFEAYRSQDRDMAERLLAQDFVFTSPQDDHIDKATYTQRCFTTADRFVSQEIIEPVSAGGDGAFILYEYELSTGERYATPSSSRCAMGNWSRRKSSSVDAWRNPGGVRVLVGGKAPSSRDRRALIANAVM
jgi:hypothetical protein